MQKLKDNIAVVWFFISTIAVAAMAYFLHRKNIKISELVYEVQSNKIKHKLENAKEKAKESGEDYEKDNSDYTNLKRRYKSISDKLGI